MSEASTVERINLTEQELFDRLVELVGEQLALADDIAQLKKDNKFNKKTNPKGISAADIGLVFGAAKLEAAAKYEEFTEKSALLKEKFETLTGYND
jgi:hypothetical protein